MRIYRNAGNAGENWSSLVLSPAPGAAGEVVEFCVRGGGRESYDGHFKTVRLTRNQVEDLITQLSAFVPFPKEKLGTIEGTDYTTTPMDRLRDKYTPRSCD